MRKTVPLLIVFAAAIALPLRSGDVKPGSDKARWPIKTSLPDGTDPAKAGTLIDLSDLLSLQPAADRMTKDFESARYPKTSGAKYAEGQIVRTRGYLRLVAGEGDGDYHIQISTTADTFDDCLVVEVPNDDKTFIAKAPELIPLAKTVRAWVTNSLKLTKDPQGRILVMQRPPYVEVTGQLFFDAEHQAAMGKGEYRGKSIKGKQLPSKTSWELHPVIKMAFAPAPK
jgi:hypothetical protein